MEISYFWDGIVIGDAAPPNAPYSNDEFSDVWGSIAQFDRRSMHLVYADLVPSANSSSGYWGYFNIQVDYQTPHGGIVTIGAGVALIDGKVFRFSGVQTFPIQIEGDYRIVIRKSWEAQYVSFHLVSSNDVPDADITQDDGDIWQTILIGAEVDSNGVLTVQKYNMGTGMEGEGDANSKWFNQNPVVASRQGGSSTIWSTGGTTNYIVGATRLEIGSIPVGANPTIVTFSDAFPYAPIVFLMPHDPTAAWAGNNMWLSAVSASQFSVSFDSTVDLDGFFYMAFGALV